MVLLALGLLLTVAWLWIGWYYVAVYIGESNLFFLLPAELGQFLLGFLAPLGILWLLVSQAATRKRLVRLEAALKEMSGQAGKPAAAAPSPPRARDAVPHLSTPGGQAGKPPAPPREEAAPPKGAMGGPEAAERAPDPTDPSAEPRSG